MRHVHSLLYVGLYVMCDVCLSVSQQDNTKFKVVNEFLDGWDV